MAVAENLGKSVTATRLFCQLELLCYKHAAALRLYDSIA
jgi:hypothetical protein